MDAFAVSIGKGLTVKKLRDLDAFKTALWFGGFQALFPLLGYFAASTFSKYVTTVDHWIIFVLLALIGGNMVREAFEEDEENAKETADFDWKHMLPLAVACSIDAFAVGVSFAFMSLNIWISVIDLAYYIDPQWQGRGVGTYTLTKLLEECRKRNMRKACGIIFADNAGSIALMKRFGFTQFGLMPTAATDSTGTMRDMSYWYLDL